MGENRFLKIIIAVLAIYGIIGFFVLPTVLKPQLVKIINENITKTATIQNIAFNPFTFMFKIKGFKIEDETQEIVSFKEFYLNFSLLKSLHKRHLSFSNVNLVDAKINIIEDKNGVINLTTIAKNSTTKPEDKKSVETTQKQIPINFKILKTVLDNATITYTKNSVLDPFAISINRLDYTFYDLGSYRNSLASHSLETYINENTKLKIDGGFRLEPFNMYAKVSLKNLKPTQLLTYKQSMLNFDLDEKAALDLNFGYQLDMKKGLDLKVQKLYLGIRDINLSQKDKSILSFKNFALEDMNLEYPAQKVNIKSLLLSSLNTNIITSKKGVLNLANLVKQEEKKEIIETEQKIVKKEESKPWFVNLRAFNLAKTNINYDDSKTKHFVKTSNINLDINSIVLKGQDIDINSLKLSKPDISYKNTSTKLALTTKELELQIDDIKKVKDSIFVKTLELKEPFVNFKDDKNKMAVQTKKLVLKLNDISKINNEIIVKKLALKQPSISYKNAISTDDVFVKNTNIDISNIKAINEDISVGLLSLAKPDISYKNKKAKLDVKTDDLKVVLKNISKKANNITIKDFSLSQPKVNIKDNKTLKYINIKGIALNLNRVSYKDSIASIKKISFKKKTMKFEDKISKNKIDTKNINLNINNLKYANNTLAIKSTSLNKPYISVVLPKKPKVKKTEKKEEKTNKKASIKPKTKKKKKVKKDDFKMDIGPFKIKDAKLLFEDKNLPIPFKTLVSSLNGDFSEFNTRSSKPTKLKLEGKVDKYGYTKITGFVEHKDIKELTDVTLLFKNIAIKNFTPYSGKFIGREIESGKLNLNLKYNIKRSNLDASNSIIISDIKLGENVESPDAVSLPLELAIALLEDSNGVIDLQLPISGNVDDPQFSIAPIVWKVFTNLIVKAITSPFSLLASLLGIEADDIKSIEFEYADSAILASEKEALDNIAKILVKRPKLGIKVHPTYDKTNDVNAIKDIKTETLIDNTIKTVKIKKGDKYKLALEKIYVTYKKELPIKELQKTFIKKEKGKKPLFESERYLEKIKDIIKNKQTVTKEELLALTTKRVEAIKKYLVTTKKVPANKIIITEIKELEKSTNFTKFDLEVDVSK